MTVPAFSTRRKAWSAPPVDDIGYLLSTELLTWDDEALIDLIREMAEARYGGWRNYQMRWRTILGLDRTRDKDVLDYGCGVGLEALQYAKNGNRVTVADIAVDNTLLAERVLGLEGHKCQRRLIHQRAPFIDTQERFDVIHCCGVLHHIPNAVEVVEFMSGLLRPNGELRLMVYSDRAWRIATGTEPPRGPVEDHPEFTRYWQHWDPIGGYADWYDRPRLAERFGEWFLIDTCAYLTEHGEYMGAVLVRR